METLLKNIRKELNKHVDPAYKKGSARFFKEDIRPIGVRAAMVRKIAKQYFPKDKTKKDIFDLCERLLQKRTMEETTIAWSWCWNVRHDFAISDFARFERWLKAYVNNWAFCDDFCTYAFGYLVNTHPELVRKTKRWTASKNRWQRRAAAVILIYPWTKPNSFLKEIFEVADALLEDTDDLVQKGYGWMLKVAADHHPKEVFSFVMKRKNRMPRTALRYAIEKYPKDMREKAMK
jgi:3-methyladenine DNA glycosylase AlkD